MPKSIFFSQFLEENSQFQIGKKWRKIIIFIMVKVGLKLSNNQHCTVSYEYIMQWWLKFNTTANSDKYMMYFMIWQYS